MAQQPNENEKISFEILDDTLCISAMCPILWEVYNEQTEKDELKLFGVVRAIYKLDRQFVTRLTQLVQTELNIFSTRGLLSGSISDYANPMEGGLAETENEFKLTDQPVRFDNIDINGRDYFQGTLGIYGDGKLLGSMAALQSTAVAKANTVQMIKYLALVFFICFVLIIPLAIVFSNKMTQPIAAVVTGLQDVAEGEGDLTKRLKVRSNDEVGDLAKWFNIFMERLQQMVKSISENVGEVTTSAGNLSGISTQMTQNADQITSRSESVASSSAKMSSNIDSVAASMEEASTNMTMVAGAAEEMNATISEIAQNSEKARNITADAVSRRRTHPR